MGRLLPALALLAGAAFAVEPAPPVALRLVASGLAAPIGIANAHDGSDRLFVIEQAGTVRIVRDGVLLAVPFLDIRSRVASGGERGLLGIAFHPRFAENRRFFVYYTMLPNDGSGGALRVAEFRASAADPDRADAGSEREILTIAHPVNANHNGGQLAFGPDGYLYVATGDGGGAGDAANNAQTLTVLLGKILRLDVDVDAGYAIPPDNPAYTAVPAARREAWAYGLRNPWRFSFDRDTGDLYIGDVGQGAVEEVDFVPAPLAGGLNFGWHVMEGDTCFGASSCSLPGAAAPAIVYRHDAAGGDSITGGYVYRGARSASLRGYYFYGDYVSTRVWAAARDAQGWSTFEVLSPPNPIAGLSTFGEGEDGELYLASHAGGALYAIDGPDDGAARLTSPVPGTSLAGPSQAFAWNAAPGASLYQLWIGSSPGAFDLGAFPQRGTTGTGVVASGLPTDGRTLHVRLFTGYGARYLHRDYTFTAAASSADPAAIAVPPDGATLEGTSQVFQWNAAEGATLYQLWLGTSPGAHDLGFYPAAGTAGTQVQVDGLPTDGRAIHARLWSAIGDRYFFRDFRYVAASAAAGFAAALASPVPGATLAGTTQPFQWNAAPGATLYQLWIGSAPGTFDIGFFPAAGTNGTSVLATGLPLDGRVLHARLWSLIGGVYQFRDATFVAAFAPPQPATIVSPAPGATLSAAGATFTWNAAPGAQLYQLWAGSSLGSHDLGFFPAAGTTATSLAISGLPSDGRAIHVRLWTLIDGTYRFTDALYAGGP